MSQLKMRANLISIRDALYNHYPDESLLGLGMVPARLSFLPDDLHNLIYKITFEDSLKVIQTIEVYDFE